MNDKYINTIIDEIITLIEHKQKTWEGLDVIISIPILFSGWLFTQHLIIKDGVYTLTQPNRINLFKKNYYVYNHIFKKITEGIQLSKSNSSYYENMVKNIIIKICECGGNGKFCSYKFVRGIVEVDSNEITYDSNGYVYVPRKKGSLEEFLS